MSRITVRALIAAATMLATGAVTVIGIGLLDSASQAGASQAASSPSVDRLDPAGVLVVDVGEPVQAIPANEPHAMAFDGLLTQAREHPTDLGYPWIDPGSGELVLSAATDAGRALLEATGPRLDFPYRIRDVAHSHAELQQIQDDATRLVAAGLPDAALIYEIVPDHRDNKTMIVISEMSRPLLDALAERFPPDAIAIQVDPTRGPLEIDP